MLNQNNMENLKNEDIIVKTPPEKSILIINYSYSIKNIYSWDL